MGQKTFSFEAQGNILSAQDHGEYLAAAIDPSPAYPQILSWERHFSLTANELLVTDHIQLDAPHQITWLLHTLSRPEKQRDKISMLRKNIRLCIQPESGLLPTVSIRDEYDVPLNAGEPDEYHVSMPPQFHLAWETKKQQTHEIRVRFLITKEE